MLRTILTYGLLAGVTTVLPMGVILINGGTLKYTSEVVGYLFMFLAFSLVFVAVKRHRDKALGGVIGFLPALMLGLGISAVAGLVYVAGWEVTMAATHNRFADVYGASLVEAARAKGASAAELARMKAEMLAFKARYANPFFRLPITFAEVFPIGAVVSVVTGALLRNRRFLPARAVAA
jgi:hypothetical protein